MCEVLDSCLGASGMDKMSLKPPQSCLLLPVIDAAGVGTYTLRPLLILPRARFIQGNKLFRVICLPRESGAQCADGCLRVIPHPLRGCELLCRLFWRQRWVRSCRSCYMSCLKLLSAFREPSLNPWFRAGSGYMQSSLPFPTNVMGRAGSTGN